MGIARTATCDICEKAQSTLADDKQRVPSSWREVRIEVAQNAEPPTWEGFLVCGDCVSAISERSYTTSMPSFMRGLILSIKRRTAEMQQARDAEKRLKEQREQEKKEKRAQARALREASNEPAH
jgi:hypothetical protein